MDRETFTKGLEITLSKTNMPNGNGIDLENICKDFALLAYDEALILHSVVVPKGTLPNNCKVCGRTIEEMGKMTSMCGVSACPNY
jgi:hypothetical protein